ncbi:ATP-dependent Clp protease adaptor ClpS [Helicobacter pylori]|uniref:ATP-dependent Clp protease adapter protein ClpS n=1 Tax=Helicobacter pylori TaxID=210 RepID=A0ABD6HI90_HELPX|nr:ATP-dependent Clp protease adaptor ClpS [Helicobacter pylori]MUU40767.1 ATP-dependent Clp protease adaptor ClpS [Helicobacter pylori]WQV73288.1 ATP-dependent Clp protease adaptor ClpS [Helicobacter pylori]
MKMYNIPTPTMAQVIMVDDPITTAEFVISALRDFFDKPLEEAQELMLSIHRDGDGVCGVYPYEIAIYKAVCVRDKARALRFPLRLMVQEVK